MRKVILWLCFVLGSVSLSYGQRTFWLPYSHRGSLQVYGAGVIQTGAKSNDFENFDLSNWGFTGLKSQNPSLLESRWRVPAADYTQTGMIPAFAFGVEWFMTGRISFLTEGQVHGKTNYRGFHITAGANYYLFSVQSFVVGVGARAGITLGNRLVMGGANLINSPIRYNVPPYGPDEANPEQGLIYVRNGSITTGHFTGFTFQAGLTGIYWLKPQIGIKTLIGIGGSRSGTFDYKVEGVEGDTELTFTNDDSFVVKTDLSNFQANLQPSFTTFGFYASVGVVLRLRLPKY